jgi:hypothetical protein
LVAIWLEVPAIMNGSAFLREFSGAIPGSAAKGTIVLPP